MLNGYEGQMSSTHEHMFENNSNDLHSTNLKLLLFKILKAIGLLHLVYPKTWATNIKLRRRIDAKNGNLSRSFVFVLDSIFCKLILNLALLI